MPIYKFGDMVIDPQKYPWGYDPFRLQAGNHLVRLNGHNAYIQYASSIIPTGPFTIAIKFIKPTLPISSNEELIATVFATANRGARVWVDTDGRLTFVMTYGSSGNWAFQFGPTCPIDYRLHLGVFSFTGTTASDGAKIYLDDMSAPAAVATSVAANDVAHTDNLIIGRASDRSDRFYNGGAESVGVWGRELNHSDRLTLLTGGMPETPVMFSALESGSGPTAVDSSSNGNNGTIYNGEWIEL